MPLSNSSRLPPIWTEEQLSAHAEQSLNGFVDRRLAESDSVYLEQLAQRRRSVEALFELLSPINPKDPDPKIIERILSDENLEAAFRYLAGPPISKDDLGVVVTRSAASLSRKMLRASPVLAQDTLKLICRIADASRFPWVTEGRKARPHEIKHAIRSTAVLHAAQATQTYRRRYGRQVESQMRSRLEAEGFQHVRSPSRAKVNAPKDYPSKRTFYGECTVYRRKTDLLIGLSDGRVVAVEAKDSSSALNSVKRVLNDTAAKARHWGTEAGKQLIPVALLSGVFAVKDLKAAQGDGLYLVWAHELDSFIAWLAAQ